MYNSLITNFVTKKKNWIMRSTFKVLFYVNGSKEKNGIVPIMGRVTINGSVAQFSCKLTIAKTMWDAKGNRAKGKSKEARDINLALDNIKAQIIKHYQRISDSLVLDNKQTVVFLTCEISIYRLSFFNSSFTPMMQRLHCR